MAELTPFVDDPRVRCVDCTHHKPRAFACDNWRAAGLETSMVSRDLSKLKQHCPGFQPKEKKQ